MIDFTTRARRDFLGMVALLASVASIACTDGGQDAQAKEPEAPVQVGRENIAIVTVTRIESGPSISGSLAPEREAAIRAELGGQVLQAGVDAGQRVAQGQLLVRIDDVSVRDSYLSARSAVTAARSAAELAERELGRMTTLAEAGAVAERQVEQARSANAGAQSQLSDATARLTLAQQQLANARVTAPFSGVVSERPVNVGDVVAPGTLLVRVVDPSSMRLEASVAAEQLSSVRIGAPVRFTVSGYGDRTFEGRVTRINPTADPATRQVRILVSIPNVGNALVGGLFAEGRVATDAREAPVVPESAVDQRGPSPSVIRVRAGVVERVPVQIGIADRKNETIEIREGLAAGDTILLGTARGITEGSQVRVSEPVDRS